MNIKQVKKLNIPLAPGCYQFFNIKKEILYIGKAAKLKSRVLSYWRPGTELSIIKQKMVKEIDKIKIIECTSEMEALLLEANLIKKHRPHYNILMRDDKRYAYIKVSTEEKWPKIHQTRKIDNAGTFFGPFTSGIAIKTILKTLRDIWPHRSCRIMPKKPCLYYHINKCPGMCAGYISEDEYKKTINKILKFLSGNLNNEIKKIKTKIELLKKENNQEKANKLKYELINTEKILNQTQIISKMDKFTSDVIELAKILNLKKIPKRIEGYDIAHTFGKEIVGSMVVFENGEANKNEYRKFKIKNNREEINDTKMLKEIIMRRFNNDWKKPDLILVDGGKAQLNATISALQKSKINCLAMSISKGKGLRSAIAPDRLYFPKEKEPLILNLNSPALHILKRIRDEAHRFAIEFHKKRRSKLFMQ